MTIERNPKAIGMNVDAVQEHLRLQVDEMNAMKEQIVGLEARIATLGTKVDGLQKDLIMQRVANAGSGPTA